MSLSKKKKINFYFVCIVLVCIATGLYFFISIQSKIALSIIQLHTLDLGEIKKSIVKDVVIIRKSVPIVSSKSGIVTRFYQQGDRVSKNAVICKVQDSTSQENEIAKLNNINLQIEDIKNNVESYPTNIKTGQIQNDINYLYLDIQQRIKNKDYKYVSTLKAELDSLLRRKQELDGVLSNQGKSLDDLIHQKKELEKKILVDKTYVKTPMAGDISYYYDSYEQKFSFENMNKITVKEINSASNEIKKIQDNNVKDGSLLCYVVDNHQYYLATSIDKEDVQAIKRDVKLTIIINNNPVNAYFYDFYKDKNGEFVGLFRVESDDFDFLKNRKENVKIIYDYAKGILIPNSAIIKKQEKEGVYVVDEIGNAKFVYLEKKLIYDNENTIIRFSYDDFNDSSKIKLYDEVILSPKNISDGQKVR